MLTLESPDGAAVSAYDEGSGPVGVVIVGGGLDDGRAFAKVSRRLAARHRVLRLIRRQYRCDAATMRPIGIQDEAADVITLATMLGRPCYLVGHSSGGVVALEATIAAPDCFDALAVFEAPVSSPDLPLGSVATTRAARHALDVGHPAKALTIFLRDVVHVSPVLATLSGLAALSPRYRSQLIPGQIADYEALRRLGDRVPEYAAIAQHVLLLTGGKSPEHLKRRSQLLERVLASRDAVQMDDAGHGAPMSKPEDVARLLLADIDARIAT